jgi:DNA-binding CsgD family transcriptional regulator
MPADQDLTERELQILRLVATGASNKEIARALQISPNTVKVHLRNIFGKIGVASRTEATLYSLRLEQAATPESMGNSNPTLPSATVDQADHVEGKAPPGQARPARRIHWAWVAGLAAMALVLTAIAMWASLLQSRSATPAEIGAPVRWQSAPDLPQGRAEMAAAVYAGRLYLISGRTSQGLTPSVLSLDLDENIWQETTPKPTPVRAAQAAVVGEHVYVPGGCLQDGSAIDQMEVYDPRQQTWEQRAHLPLPLCAYALAQLEGRLYLFGGWDGTQVTGSTLIYDPAVDTWSSGEPFAPARQYAAAVSENDQIHLIGGQDDKGQPLADHQVYLPARDLMGGSAATEGALTSVAPTSVAWETLAPMPAARYGMGAVSLAGLVFVMGGQGSVSAMLPLEYLPGDDRWMELGSPPQPNGVFLSVLPVQTRLHLIGGEISGQLTARHQSYQAVFTILMPVVQ